MLLRSIMIEQHLGVPEIKIFNVVNNLWTQPVILPFIVSSLDFAVGPNNTLYTCDLDFNIIMDEFLVCANSQGQHSIIFSSFLCFETIVPCPCYPSFEGSCLLLIQTNTCPCRFCLSHDNHRFVFHQ